MDIKLRAQKTASVDLAKVGCANVAELLVPVKATTRLIIEPIWVVPVDDIEGDLMKDFVETHPEYTQIYVRHGVERRLVEVSELLPSDMKLIVRAGHRPVEVQLELLERLMHKYLLEHTGATRPMALAHARQYVSDPAIKLPPHCCGAAVDVDVFDVVRNRLVDFGCPVNTDSEAASLFSDRVTDKQRSNRMLLADSMLRAGFACYYHEWWHYSYGDQVWAAFYEQPEALYGIADDIAK